MPVSAMLLFDE